MWEKDVKSHIEDYSGAVTEQMEALLTVVACSELVVVLQGPVLGTRESGADIRLCALSQADGDGRTLSRSLQVVEQKS